MATITFNGQVIADAGKTESVSGYTYVPHEAIKKEFFTSSELHTTCPFKGKANYYNIAVDGKTLTDACWYYPETKEGAQNIKNWVGFYEKNGVKIQKK